MVASSKSIRTKSEDKVPSAKHSVQSKFQKTESPVTPTDMSLEDEVLALRARNKVLTESLKAVEEAATEQFKTNFELVWFARHRTRYPSHEASIRIEQDRRAEISKLRGPEGDYHHGFNTGLLAASRMFKEHASIHSSDDMQEWSEMMNLGAKHKDKIKASREAFPDVNTEEFPQKAE